MATVRTFDEFFNHLVTGVHGNMNSGQTYKLALTNTAPVKATSTVLADITQISSNGGYAPATITMTWAETGAGTGIWQLGDANSDVTFTASGAAFDTFRYVVLYNDTPTSPADPLIAVLDYGSAVNLADGASFQVNAGSSGWVQYTTPAWT